MTEYDDNLNRIQQVAIPEFYVFSSGSDVERYTSFSRDLSFLGYTFSTAPIKRSEKIYDDQFSILKITISAPITDNIAKYISNQPIEPVLVSIYRSNINDLSNYEIIFRGDIKYVQLKGNVASLQCESNNKILETKIPNVIYQSFCNHDIYDDGCGVIAADYKYIGEVTAINGDGESIDITYVGGTPSSGALTGGRVVLDTDMRLITSHSGGTIEVHVPFDQRLVVGSLLDLYLGCDGDPSTCVDRFNNLARFLGMPYIPSTNPVVWGFK